jgi:hypothetical protein
VHYNQPEQGDELAGHARLHSVANRDIAQLAVDDVEN